MELELAQGGIFTPQEKKLYSSWINEWGEFAMNDLPSELRFSKGYFGPHAEPYIRN